jgi:hypothetical protein
MLLLAGVLVVLSADPMQAYLRETAYARVGLAKGIARKSEVMAFVAAKNGEAEPLERARQQDQHWANNPLRKALTENPCASTLKKLTASDPVVVEVLLMDNQGALVCSSVETSDYYQGDEAKWQKTFQEGLDPFIDSPALDPSTGKYAIQVSVPVADGGTLTTGASKGRGSPRPHPWGRGIPLGASQQVPRVLAEGEHVGEAAHRPQRYAYRARLVRVDAAA